VADVPSDSEATRDDVAAATHMHEYKHCMCNLQRMIPCQTGALPKVLHRPQALADGGAQLEELELALNEVTAAGAGALAAALARQPRLRRLALRENELGDGGALALAPGLAALPVLAELDLCQNEARRARPGPGAGGGQGGWG